MTTTDTQEHQDDNNSEGPVSSARTFKLVTLRIPPDIHQEVTTLAGKLQAHRGKQVSVNSLINEAIEQYIRRHKNPKMLKDFEGL